MRGSKSSTSIAKPARKIPTKEDEAERSLVERVRAVQKSHQSNRRCADCVEGGPTYVCLDFCTFVCQSCCGIHREFGHRTKSITLSKWTEAEVQAIENGGNDRAAAQWMASWRHGHMEKPPSGNEDKIREFIREKYREKRWWREIPAEKLALIGSKPEALSASAKAASANVPQQQQQQLPKPSGPAHAKPAADLLMGGPDTGFPRTPIAPSIPIDAGGSWTADFSAPSISASPAAPAPAPAAPSVVASGLLDIDFTTVAAPTGQSGVLHVVSVEPIPPTAPTVDVVCDPLLSLDLSPSAPAQALDVSAPAAAPGAGQEALNAASPSICEPSPTTESANEACTAISAAEAAPTEDSAISLGDRLRQAVLNGNGEEVLRLFGQCNANSTLMASSTGGAIAGMGAVALQPGAQAVDQPAKTVPGRFACLQDMSIDELSSVDAAPTVPPIPEGSVVTPARDQTEPPNAADPPSLLIEVDDDGSADNDPGSARFFYIGDDDSPAGTPTNGRSPHQFLSVTDGMPTSLASSPTAQSARPPQAKPHALPATPALPGGVPPLLSSTLTPHQLSQISPQQLMQMQAMINQALQMREGTRTLQQSGRSAPAMNAAHNGARAIPTHAAAAPGGISGYGTDYVPGGCGIPSPDSPVQSSGPKQFDDLVQAFNAKSPVLGFS